MQSGKTLIFPWFPWLLVHSIAWPVALVSASWVGIKWIGWLAAVVPGEPRLGFNWYPTHQYVGLFLWSAFLLGGVIMGLWVGVAQWLVLGIWGKMRGQWVVVNMVAWTISALAFRAAIHAVDSTRGLDFNFAWIPAVVGGLITGFCLQQALAKVDEEQRQQPREQSLLYDKFTGYGIVFAGIGAGLVTSFLVAVIAGG